MADHTFRCPHCHEACSVIAELAGETVTCPNPACLQSVTIPPLGTPMAPPPEPEPEPEPVPPEPEPIPEPDEPDTIEPEPVDAPTPVEAVDAAPPPLPDEPADDEPTPAQEEPTDTPPPLPDESTAASLNVPPPIPPPLPLSDEADEDEAAAEAAEPAEPTPAEPALAADGSDPRAWKPIDFDALDQAKAPPVAATVADDTPSLKPPPPPLAGSPPPPPGPPPSVESSYTRTGGDSYPTYQRNDPLAIASLVAGILGIAGCCCCLLGFPGAITAIITGHISLKNIRNSEELTGEQLAMAGLIMGYIGLAVSILYLIFNGVTNLASEM